jgi:hypothetical protein
MEWIIVVVVAIALVVILKKSNKNSNVQQEVKKEVKLEVKKEVKLEVKKSNFPYKKVLVLFSPSERSFLGVLEQAVGDGAKVFGKVRVADVILPEKSLSRSNWQQAFNKISGKHFDYLLCKKDDLSVICAIELDDSSHQSESRKKRDEFLSAVCDAAGVPLVQVPAKQGYVIAEIRNILVPHVGTTEFESIETNPDHLQMKNEEMLCPKCSSILVKRLAKKGSNAGNQFWGCSAFPKCRYTERIKTSE